jgi:hypothetical protein
MHSITGRWTVAFALGGTPWSRSWRETPRALLRRISTVLAQSNDHSNAHRSILERVTVKYAD